jgi:hypothetical protein
MTLERLRSYSTIFSSTSFSKLLKYEDYSFIDSKISRYDKNQIGIRFNTYYDYLKYIYNALSKGYRNEYIYKNTFISKLLINTYGLKDIIAINEFRVGNSIADLVMFNGTSKAFEIKTELDTNKRLNGQLDDYTKIFRESYIVTHESLSEKYLQEDSSIGIIELVDRPKSLQMREIRPAKEINSINVDTLMRSIRTPEYKNIVKQYFGKLPEMNSFNMFEICKEYIKTIPQENLHYLFISELKKRKSNTNIIRKFPLELRQLYLAMNIDIKLYQEFENKLNKQINL